jgi:hypothetical protein
MFADDVCRLGVCVIVHDGQYNHIGDPIIAHLQGTEEATTAGSERWQTDP